jgi:tetratricopeptide (TPR) repeat protein
MTGYFLTLLAGGIALFIPGPWLVSYAFRYDFTTSFLIFMALVNIHHFLLDGALWKLRDSRVSSLLVSCEQDAVSAVRTRAKTTRSIASRVITAPAFRVSLAALLFLWGGMDQIHFALGTDEGNLAALSRAASLNPYDATIEERIGAAETKAGNKDEAVEALTRAVEINPNRVGLQEATARAMLEDGRFADAYEHYKKMLETFPHDTDALVNYGLLAARLGRPEEAMDSWQKAADMDANRANAHLYLAEGFDQRGELASAARHWKEFLRLTAAHPDDPSARATEPVKAAIQLADDESRLNLAPAAIADYKSGIAFAERAGNARLESVALAHLADLQEKTGDAKAAGESYQRGISLDAKSGDSHSEAIDWFNYGQFLRRHGLPDELAYACILRAENLLARATSLPAGSFQTSK